MMGNCLAPSIVDLEDLCQLWDVSGAWCQVGAILHKLQLTLELEHATIITACKGSSVFSFNSVEKVEFCDVLFRSNHQQSEQK